VRYQLFWKSSPRAAVAGGGCETEEQLCRTRLRREGAHPLMYECQSTSRFTKKTDANAFLRLSPLIRVSGLTGRLKRGSLNRHDYISWEDI